MNSPAIGSSPWLQQQVMAFQAEHAIYSQYAEALKGALAAAAKRYAPEAIIQARPKSLASFAEKAMRKVRARDPEGDDPVNRMTDLCGGRIIVHTREEVEAVCAWIRQVFDIDEQNSQDTAVRLRTGEFGYQSVHFIVQLKTGCRDILGVGLSPDIGRRKAEIQVRTIAQHAWADTTHDRLYKGPFKPPELYRRDAARVAALLEEADKGFGELVRNLDSYRLNFGAYMSRQAMEQEIQTLELVMQAQNSTPVSKGIEVPQADREEREKNFPHVRLRIARVACAAGSWAKVAETLDPVQDESGPMGEEIRARLGFALCHKSDPGSEAFAHGQALMAKVGRPKDAPCPKPNPIRAQALAHLAWSHRRVPGNFQDAHDLYALAYQCDPANPIHLQHYLEARLVTEPNLEAVQVLRPALREAAARCRAFAAVKIELPWAWLALGRFHSLLGEPFPALAAYAKAVQLAHGAEELEGALETTRRLRDMLGRKMPSLEWIERLLELGIAASRIKTARQQPPADREDAWRQVRQSLAGKTTRFDKGPICATDLVLIVAGGTSAASAEEVGKQEQALFEALRGFKGLVISGGTTAGIPGMVGRITARLREAGRCDYRLLGYLPDGELPDDAQVDVAYEIQRAGKEGLTSWQPLQSWSDLMAAGVDPESVIILGINGGDIAGFEYRLGAALGATVAVVQNTRREADTLLNDSDWSESGNLLPLCQDPASILAFVQSRLAETRLTPDQIEAAAQRVHGFYREDRQKEIKKWPLAEWKLLGADFQNSNRGQARYAEHILLACGFALHPLSEGEGLAGRKTTAQDGFTDDEVRQMAEMEHGRWVVERLQAGWRYGEKKDEAAKLSPYLVSWADLPEEIRGYDCDAVRRFPEILRNAGYAVRRSRSGS
jgi:ppGpp synthetase/RelA/SpoT-type nucleotidyltranferase/tetratricopeptide (TPR) repeat protein